MIRVGINGFGRIGKGIFRIIEEMGDDVEVVAIKDLSLIKDHEEYLRNIAYLLKYDSIYGEFPNSIDVEGDCLIVGDNKIPVFLSENITDVDWGEMGVDVLIEASGEINNILNAKNCLSGSVSKVVITRGFSESDFAMVIGVNEKEYDPDNHNLISCSTCTGNAFAPLAKFVDDNYGINNGFVASIHPFLSSEKVIDGFSTSFQLGRASKTVKMTHTSVVKSTLDVLPTLKGKLSTGAVSFRLPTDIVSIVHANLILDKKVKKSDFLDKLRLETQQSLKGILDISSGFMNHSLVGTDFIKNPHSGVVEESYFLTHGNMCSISIWHDNEYGYCRRVYDTIKLIF